MLSDTSDAGGHLLIVPLPAWGHIRPLTTFAIKVVQIQANLPSKQRTLVTLFTVGDFTARLKEEIAQNVEELPENKNDILEWIRVICIGGKGFDPAALIPILWGQFSSVYDSLLEKRTLSCASTGMVYRSVPRPSAAIADYIAFPIIKAIRSKGPSTPVFAWIVNTAACTLWWFGPKKHGGLGDVQSQLLEDLKREVKSDADLKEFKEEAWRPSLGNLVRLPGMPPFYDYEASPQEPCFSSADSLAPTLEFFSLAVGVLVNSCSVYEPTAMPVLRSWLESSGKLVYDVGPLVPAGYNSVMGPASLDVPKIMESGRDSEAVRFLDSALKKHGERSVLYFSFGSLFWPSKSEYVWAWLELLLELGIPFILSTATLSTKISELLLSKIAQSGLGLLVEWAPQPDILTHLATGWFMSHCGHNSATEAMAAGIPIIAWPIDGDQPFTAAYQALTLDTAFELVQVRTGSRGLRPLYRGVEGCSETGSSFLQPQGTLEAVIVEAREVMDRARGEEGKRKRRNAQALRENIIGIWGIDGAARRSAEEFLAWLGVH